MGGSSKQVVGHQYYASLVKFIGFRIDRLIGVNFDNRKWLYLEDDVSHLNVSEPDLYGENEGGVKGMIDVHLGTPDQEPNMYYKVHDPEISGFPYQSYLVFHGEEDTVEEVEATDKFGQTYSKFVAKLGQHSFYHGNTNTMRDVLLWPKRTRVQNDGTEQWHKNRGDGAIVCEIEARSENGGGFIEPTPVGDIVAEYVLSNGCDLSGALIRKTYTSTYDEVKLDPGPNDQPNRGWFIEGPHDDNSISAGCLNTGGSKESTGVYSGSIRFGGSGVIVIAATIFTPPNSIGRNINFLTNAESYSQHYTETLEGHEGRLTCVMHIQAPATLNFEFNVESIPHNSAHYYRYGLVDVRFYQRAVDAPSAGSGVDINPIHKIREILTNPSPWGMGKDAEDEINDVNFRKAADRIYDEGLGISWAIKDKDCLEAINELCHHIEAGVRVNRQTGKHEVVLFRDDWFEDDEIHTILESQIKSMQLEVQNADDVINHVNVTYYDRENIKDGAFSISENGLIKTVGQVVSEDIEFPYFMRRYNAEKVAAWKLKQLSTPAWKGTFATGLRESRKWNRYDLIDLPWSKKWGGTIRARIMAINLGTATDNQVTIEFVEVVDFSNVQPQIGTDVSYGTQILEPQQSYATVFELPYYLAVYTKGQKEADEQLNYDNTIGYVAALAMPVQYNSINAALYSDDAGLNEDLEKVATVNYCDAVVSDQIITKTMHSFTVKDTPFTLTNRARKFAGAAAGTLIKINDEFMSFESYDDATKVMTVSRGVLDTGVFEHAANSDLFIFDTADLAINAQQFIESDVVESKVLTTTPSGILKIGEAPLHTTEIQARAIRPYPPANVKICGEYWPAEIEGDLEITWANRNRLQQTAMTHIDWFDANNMPLEENAVNMLVLTEFDEDQIELRTQNINVGTLDGYIFAVSAMDLNTRYIEIELKTVQSGFECLNPFTHTIELSQFFSEPYDLTVEFKND